MSNQHSHADLAPTALLQLVGHPIRWRLLSELARSDRMVQELSTLIGQPPNLVSYHLSKLRDARLVASQQSSADRRDAYYTIDLARIGGQLSAAGGALHPGLRLAPPPIAGPAGAAGVRVLFLCTGNSARSQMAEAFVRARSNGLVEAYSAGSYPKPLHPDALRVMRDEYGIDLSQQRPKHLNVFADQRFDWVISLCDQVREVCPEFPDQPATVHWSTRNPAAGPADGEASNAAFQRSEERRVGKECA